jgi:hypothetical protein
MSVRNFVFAGCLSVVLVAAYSWASPSDQATQKPVPKEMVLLKKLSGKWEGSSKMGDKTMPVTITYDVTAGGSAVIEKLFPGTPHEMISVYSSDGTKTSMTHYCAMGNQPKMALKKSDDKTLTFEMVGMEGPLAQEPHMHALTLIWVTPNHIKETWTSYDKGSVKEEKTFELTRK